MSLTLLLTLLLLLLSLLEQWDGNNELWWAFALPLNWSASEREGDRTFPLCGPLVHIVQKNPVTSKFLNRGGHPSLFGEEERVFIYVRVDSTRWEEKITQKDSGTQLRGSTIFGFGMKPAVGPPVGGERPAAYVTYSMIYVQYRSLQTISMCKF